MVVSFELNIPDREYLKTLRSTFKTGTVVELTFDMEDPYSPIPAGTHGDVRGVDDAGQILMKWENGSSLSMIPGVDGFRIVKDVV